MSAGSDGGSWRGVGSIAAPSLGARRTTPGACWLQRSCCNAPVGRPSRRSTRSCSDDGQTRQPSAGRERARSRRSIRPLGLVRRAGTLRAMAKEVARLGGVPGDLDALEALPGVGRYAANATLVVRFGKRAPVVDGVSARVYRRYLGLPSDLPATSDRSLWEEVARATPRDASREWNWAVLDLAAEVCLPARPRCGVCPLGGSMCLRGGPLDPCRPVVLASGRGSQGCDPPRATRQGRSGGEGEGARDRGAREGSSNSSQAWAGSGSDSNLTAGRRCGPANGSPRRRRNTPPSAIGVTSIQTS